MIMVSRVPTSCCLRYTNSMIRKRFNVTLAPHSTYYVPVLEKRRSARLMESTSAKSLSSGTNAPINPSQLLVDAANKLTNQMDKLTAFKQFNQNGAHLRISCYRVTELNKTVIPWALELTRSNMRDFYEESEWGWSEKAKLAELSHENAWYLIARNTEGKAVAFVHFRFDLDCGTEVLYCYEIQLENSTKRIGLGQYLMLILELIAMQTRMQKVMLTVFKHNIAGKTFFTKKLRYELDESSPKSRKTTYEILSKKISQPSENIPKNHLSRSRKILKTSHPLNNAATKEKKSTSEENLNVHLNRELIRQKIGRVNYDLSNYKNLGLGDNEAQPAAFGNCQGDTSSIKCSTMVEPHKERKTAEGILPETGQISQKSINTGCKVE